MNFFTTLGVSLLAIIAFANAQNLDIMEVETRDNPSAYLREKRQVVLSNAKQSSGCFWSGTAPFCAGRCGRKYQEILTDERGNGRKCWTGLKKLCCPVKPVPTGFKPPVKPVKPVGTGFTAAANISPSTVAPGIQPVPTGFTAKVDEVTAKVNELGTFKIK